MKRFLRRSWPYFAAAAIGAMITPAAIEHAAEFRGFRGGIGGEFFIIPLFVLLVYLARGIAATIREVFGREEESDEEVAEKDRPLRKDQPAF